MDPLIDLPETARARIKTKEAVIEEQSDTVRRAFEADAANAYYQWGGYLDLHRDTLWRSLEEAREGSEESAHLFAPCLFLVHAFEYQVVQPDPQLLEPVLAELRESVIRRYGEKTRVTVQRVEAQQMEAALTQYSAASEIVAGENSNEASGPMSITTSILLETPIDRKVATDSWKRNWSTPNRECTNDDLTETAFGGKDRSFLNQWQNGKTRLADPSGSTRFQSIEKVLRENIPPRWHPEFKR